MAGQGVGNNRFVLFGAEILHAKAAECAEFGGGPKILRTLGSLHVILAGAKLVEIPAFAGMTEPA